MKVSIDTNLFIYAADPDSPFHKRGRDFFASLADLDKGVVCVCGLVLTEVYMQLRNPAIFKEPYSAKEAAGFCRNLKTNPAWAYIDYSQEIFDQLMEFESTHGGSFRKVIDTRIALTLRHHRVTHMATANTEDFQGFWFERVWNPLEEPFRVA